LFIFMQTNATTSEPSECLLRIVEAAPQVSRRYQFFLWSQADLQRWLPHKLLVCGAYHREYRDLVFDVFNSVPIPEAALRGLQSAREPAIVAAIKRWHLRRQQPCWLHRDELPAGDPVADMMREAGYQQLLVHGMSRPGRPEEIESIFLFGSADHVHEDQALTHAEMLLPCLHTTYVRVHTTERQMVGMGNAAGPHVAGAAMGSTARSGGITEREREILLWVRDGLSNQQISEKLGISALTVKNHVQKILRKLGAANRAQAVAKAMSLQALSLPSGGPHGDRNL
jgi:transcriptional regulator EpsA